MKTRNLDALRIDKEMQPFMSRNGGAKSFNKFSWGQRTKRGGSPLVRGSGGSYKLVQEVSFHS